MELGRDMEEEANQDPCLALRERPGGTILVDTRNGFNELRYCVMLWTVIHRWQAGAQFVFN
eukprot:7156723-Ditylum_brightwellii.AAC.1